MLRNIESLNNESLNFEFPPSAVYTSKRPIKIQRFKIHYSLLF